MSDFNIFGFTIGKKKKLPEAGIVTPTSDDGSTIVNSAAAYYGLVIDLEGSVKNESELIRRYRESAQYTDCDSAIEEIVNEAIVADSDDSPVSVVLDDLKVSESIKTKIRDEFEEVLRLLRFNEKGHDIFRQWYIDGRLPYHIMLGENPKQDGIIELRYIDPRKIRKIKNIKKEKNAQGVDVVKEIEEYYLYNDKGITESTAQGTKLSADSVVYTTSGLIDANTGMVLGYLHKAIKPVNQLKMMEDALVIYRLSRAPERRIFYIDVGNLPKIKAEQYVNDMMNKFRNKIVYDASTGEVKNNKQHLCLDMNTKVPLLDGRTLSITEIAKEYEEGKTLWAYSCDPVSGEFVPGLISWAGVTRKNASVMKLTLDNGKSIVCTPDHKFPVWNKGFVRADKLSVGESMIPHYTKHNSITEGKKKEYQQIFQNNTGEWQYTHRLVSEWKDQNHLPNKFIFNEEYAKNGLHVVHHQNINRFDNTPENLVRMNSKDHISWHHSSGSNSGKVGGRNCFLMGKGFHNKNHPDYQTWHYTAGKHGGKRSSELGVSQESYKKGRKILAELLLNEEWNLWFRSKLKEGWTEEKRKVASEHAKKNNLYKRGLAAKSEMFKDKNSALCENHRKKYKTEYPQSIIDMFIECAKNGMTALSAIQYINNSTVITDFSDINKNKVMGGQKDYSKLVKGDVGRIISLIGYSSYPQLRDSFKYRNHKIVNIEYLEEKIDTGCLTIDEDEIYHNHHTFALDAGIYTKNSMMEDFWMPRRGDGKGTEITTLQGGQNLGNIEDINFFQNKLYQSLNVPLQRLQPSTGFNLGRSTEITREEIKFNKFISRLRKKFAKLFADVLRVQLIAKGIIRADEWDDLSEKIRYDFQRDNHFTELKDSEITLTRLNSLNMVDPYVGKYYSSLWVRKNILKQTEDEIKEIDKEMEEDRDRQLSDAEHQGNIQSIQQQPSIDQQLDMQQQQQNMIPPNNTGEQQ